MNIMYGDYRFLATGGCIGDVLFFFCSGFTLFLKPMGEVTQFPNWYKRRINRIYPSVIAVAIFACVFFDTQWNIIDIIVAKRYWFISCIMLYYIAIYFVGSYFKDKIFLISLLVVIGSAIWFYFIVSERPKFSMYSGHHIRWLLFFVFMLLGAKIGTMTDKIKSSPIKDCFYLMISIAIFYALFIPGMRIRSVVYVQFFSFIPLLAAMYFFYKIGASKWAERLYKNKVGNFVIRLIGGLCLEIYMVQSFLFTDKMNALFPLNIVIMFLIIFIAAYITRCLSRFISQTFKDTPYDWRKIIALY